MDSGIVIFVSLIYLLVLFVIAIYGNKKAKTGNSIVNNPLVYSLSLTVYCTVWTFYGSVGRASDQGLAFIPVYLGPTLAAPVIYMVIRKMILISKKLHITSIADFVSSRYGKNTFLGVLTTLVLLFGIIPYISIQLKAIGLSFDVMTVHKSLNEFWDGSTFYKDKVNYFTILLAVFTILFGTRNLDPNERHEGLIAAIAFESVVKLISFLAVGVFVCYILFNGMGDLFSQAALNPATIKLLTLPSDHTSQSHWFWVMILSAVATMFLPRQFHVSVVENTNITYTRQASWMFPLYLFLICFFVLPIAIAGILLLPELTDSDTYVLSLPLHFGYEWLALLVYLGGFSAAASMVVVSVIALSIMVSNNLLMPFLLNTKTAKQDGYALLSDRLLSIRRIIIVVILFLAYAFYKGVSHHFSLVSIGLISFVAIFQLAPIIIGGLYWTKANTKGAMAGLIAGFFIWLICLPVPTLAESGLLGKDLITNGYFGIHLLKPYALFGLEGYDHISHACIWSLFFNLGSFVVVSMLTSQNVEEIAQADFYVNIEKYVGSPDMEVIKREASVITLKKKLVRYLGSSKTRTVLNEYKGKTEITKNSDDASPEFINYVEKILSGAFGAASARLILGTEIRQEPLTLEKLHEILNQTKEILEYSQELEEQKSELQRTGIELAEVNQQLKKLDELKAEFISTVTHELRTPMTTIRSFAQMLDKKEDLPAETKKEFLTIIIKECDRVKHLINQVLEVEKIDATLDVVTKSCDLNKVIEDAILRVLPLIEEKNIDLHVENDDSEKHLPVQEEKFLQVMLNLLTNAIKFCDHDNGIIFIRVEKTPEFIHITVGNNGKIIPAEFLPRIFDKFTQVKDGNLAKPEGSGLGLYITKKFVEQANGQIHVISDVDQGTQFIMKFARS